MGPCAGTVRATASRVIAHGRNVIYEFRERLFSPWGFCYSYVRHRSNFLTFGGGTVEQSVCCGNAGAVNSVDRARTIKSRGETAHKSCTGGAV